MPDEERYSGLRDTLQAIRGDQQDHGRTLQAIREEAAGTRQQLVTHSAEHVLARSERARIMERLTWVESRAAACDQCGALEQRITRLEARGEGSAQTGASWATWLAVAFGAIGTLTGIVVALLK